VIASRRIFLGSPWGSSHAALPHIPYLNLSGKEGREWKGVRGREGKGAEGKRMAPFDKPYTIFY